MGVQICISRLNININLANSGDTGNIDTQSCVGFSFDFTTRKLKNSGGLGNLQGERPKLKSFYNLSIKFNPRKRDVQIRNLADISQDRHVDGEFAGDLLLVGIDRQVPLGMKLNIIIPIRLISPFPI